MKNCIICKVTKDYPEFHPRSNAKDKHQGTCKECQAKISKEYYIINKARQRQKNNECSKKRAELTREFLCGYLKEHPCVGCGEENILFLDFHHIDPTLKEYNICRMGTRSRELLLAELAKCQVLCVKCHRIETHKQLDSYKWKVYQQELGSQKLVK